MCWAFDVSRKPLSFIFGVVKSSVYTSEVYYYKGKNNLLNSTLRLVAVKVVCG